jgi:hypothetical protein
VVSAAPGAAAEDKLRSRGDEAVMISIVRSMLDKPCPT